PGRHDGGAAGAEAASDGTDALLRHDHIAALSRSRGAALGRRTVRASVVRGVKDHAAREAEGPGSPRTIIIIKTTRRAHTCSALPERPRIRLAIGSSVPTCRDECAVRLRNQADIVEFPPSLSRVRDRLRRQSWDNAVLPGAAPTAAQCVCECGAAIWLMDGR